MALRLTWLCLTGIVVGMGWISPGLKAQSSFYVDPINGSDTSAGGSSTPFKTLQKAKSAVQAVNATMTSDINVYLKSGTYYLTSPLQFTAADSGKNSHNVNWGAAANCSPEISGGQLISGWSTYKALAGGTIYEATVPSGLVFHDLYVNGIRSVLARTPGLSSAADQGPYNQLISVTSNQSTQTASIQVNAAALTNPATNQPWTGLSGSNATVQMVCNRHWATNRFNISSFTISGALATLYPITVQQQILASSNQPWGAGTRDSYYFENSLDFLTTPGEWFLNTTTNVLYYMPRSGENMSTASVIAPVATELIDINNASHLNFNWIRMDYVNYVMPTNQTIEGQGNFEFTSNGVGAVIPGGIRLQNSSYINFQWCTLCHMGGAAIQLISSTSYTSINLCNIFDTGGNGVEVYTALNGLQSNYPTVGASTSSYDSITNTYVHEVGQDYSGACGIIATFPKYLTVSHDEVFDCPGIGISIGWGWTFNQTALQNNTVSYDHVHNCAQLHDDAAGIYNLSYQPGTVITENWIHDVLRSAWADVNVIAGIYLDNGSEGITVSNNLIDTGMAMQQQLEFNINAQQAASNSISNNGNSNTSLESSVGPQGYTLAGNPFWAPSLTPITAISLQTGFAGQTLQSNCYLLSGQYLASANGDCYVSMQNDGELCVFVGTPTTPGNRIWTSGATKPTGSYYATITLDGRLQIYAGTPQSPGELVWQTSYTISPNSFYYALMQEDGNFVLDQGYDSAAYENFFWGSFWLPGHRIALQSPACGYYVTTTTSNSDILQANQALTPGAGEYFDVYDAGGGAFALRSEPSWNYVTTVTDDSDTLQSNSAVNIGPTEKLEWDFTDQSGTALGPGLLALKSLTNNYYVSCNLTYSSNELQAGWATTVSSWEKFNYVDLGMTAPTGHCISIKVNATGTYVSTRMENNAMVQATATTPSTWERFDVYDARDGYVALKSEISGYFMSTETENGDEEQADSATTITAAEQFRWIPLGTLGFALWSPLTGCYVQCNLSEGNTLQAGSDDGAVFSWDEFTSVDEGNY